MWALSCGNNQKWSPKRPTLQGFFHNLRSSTWKKNDTNENQVCHSYQVLINGYLNGKSSIVYV